MSDETDETPEEVRQMFAEGEPVPVEHQTWFHTVGTMNDTVIVRNYIPEGGPFHVRC